MPKLSLTNEEIYEYYVNQKLPAYVISERYKIGQSTISKKLKEMGVELRAPQKVMSSANKVIPRDEFIALINEGLEYKEISKRYNVGISSVSFYAKQLGINRHPGLTTEQKNKMRELRDMGKTYREVAKEMNINVNSIGFYMMSIDI